MFDKIVVVAMAVIGGSTSYNQQRWYHQSIAVISAIVHSGGGNIDLLQCSLMHSSGS